MFGKTFFLFTLCLYIGVAMELENVKQHDVKDEAKEKHIQPELLDLEEAPLGRAEPCWHKVEVKYDVKNDVWRRHKEIFGDYESPGSFLMKPFYKQKSGNHSIWYDLKGRLTIGLDEKKGTSDAIAYVESYKLADDSCPYDPAFDWSYKKVDKFLAATDGLTIICRDSTSC